MRQACAPLTRLVYLLSTALPSIMPFPCARARVGGSVTSSSLGTSLPRDQHNSQDEGWTCPGLRADFSFLSSSYLRQTPELQSETAGTLEPVQEFFVGSSSRTLDRDILASARRGKHSAFHESPASDLFAQRSAVIRSCKDPRSLATNYPRDHQRERVLCSLGDSLVLSGTNHEFR